MEYGLVGARLGHSFSRRIHRQLGYDYQLLELDAPGFEALMARRDFKGINVTIPYKKKAFALCDETDPRAAAIGAVNTVVNRGGRLYGYNTDFEGLAWQLERQHFVLQGRRVLLLGSGGTAATAAAVAVQMGARSVRTASRKPLGSHSISYAQALADADAQFIINTTPVGMSPDLDGLPLAPEGFAQLEGLMDVVYNPLTTHLVQRARQAGVPACNGLPMLVGQAVFAAQRFTGRASPDGTVEELCGQLLADMANLVLIGMPGSGKTTLGRLLAQRMGRPFCDSDHLVEQQAGQSIPHIFAQWGEDGFRQKESDAVKTLAAATGQVIACGGGVVKRPENLRRLRQNGVLVFIHCPAAQLPLGPGRPLAQSREDLLRLEAERLPLYRAAADVEVPWRPDPAQGAEEVHKAFVQALAARGPG